MCPSEFVDHYLNPLLEKISIDKKKFMLMGDFNFDLLKYNPSNEVSHFLVSIVSNYLFPFIIQPTHITTRFKTKNCQ